MAGGGRRQELHGWEIPVTPAMFPLASGGGWGGGGGGGWTLTPPPFGSSLWIFSVFFQCLMCTEHVQLSAGRKKLLPGNISDVSCCSWMFIVFYASTRPPGRSHEVLNFVCVCRRRDAAAAAAATAVASAAFFTQRKIANEAHASNTVSFVSQ